MNVKSLVIGKDWKLKKIVIKVPPRFELGSQDSES